MIYQLLNTDSLRTTLLIRVMVGAVFISEGIQKFLYTATREAAGLKTWVFRPRIFSEYLWDVLKYLPVF
jgi:uncharacterized membrane protein YphA (DoxX/SURF4 family)